MPNKETKKDKREAARLARLEAQRRAQARKRRRTAFTGVAVVAVIVAIVLGVVLSGREDAALVADLNAAADPAGCTEVQRPDEEGHDHIDPPATVEYATNPPTSGNHYPSPGRTGIQSGAVANETQVHNLEHGHVGIQYAPGALDDATLDALEAVTREDDTWTFMAEKPDMDAPLAFTAWTRLSTCETPGSADDVAAFARLFVQLNKDHGRESFAGAPS